MHGLNAVDARGFFEVFNPGNAAAAARFKEERQPLGMRNAEELLVVGSERSLVGGNDGFAGEERLTNIRAGGFNAGQHIHYHINLRIIDDLGKMLCHERTAGFPRAAQNVAQFNAAVALGELFGNTPANRPEAEKSDLEHVFLRSNVLMSLIRNRKSSRADGLRIRRYVKARRRAPKARQIQRIHRQLPFL